MSMQQSSDRDDLQAAMSASERAEQERAVDPDNGITTAFSDQEVVSTKDSNANDQMMLGCRPLDLCAVNDPKFIGGFVLWWCSGFCCQPPLSSPGTRAQRAVKGGVRNVWRNAKASVSIDPF